MQKCGVNSYLYIFYCVPDSGLQIWANSSAITTATVLGNAAVVLGGLFLLYNSDEVLIDTCSQDMSS